MLVTEHEDAGGRPAKMPRFIEDEESISKPMGKDLVADLCKIIEQQSKEIASLRERSAGLRSTEPHAAASMLIEQEEDRNRAEKAITAARADDAAHAEQPAPATAYPQPVQAQPHAQAHAQPHAQPHVQAQPAVHAAVLAPVQAYATPVLTSVAAAAPIAATLLAQPPPLVTVTSPRDYSDGCETPPTEDESTERERLVLKRPRQVEFFSGLDALTAAADTARELPAPSAADAKPVAKPTDVEAPVRRCRECGTTNTPKWRCGMTLCNACGLRNVKRNGGPRVVTTTSATPLISRTDALVADYRVAAEKLAVVTTKPMPTATTKPMPPRDSASNAMAPQQAPVPFRPQPVVVTTKPCNQPDASMPSPGPMHTAVAMPRASSADAAELIQPAMGGMQPRFGAQRVVTTMRYAAPAHHASSAAPQQAYGVAHGMAHPLPNGHMQEQPPSMLSAIRPTATYASGFRSLGHARTQPQPHAQHKLQPHMVQQQPQMVTLQPQQAPMNAPQRPMASASPLLRALSHAGARAGPYLHPQRSVPMQQQQDVPSGRGPPVLIDAGPRGANSRNGRQPPFATLATELRTAHAQLVPHGHHHARASSQHHQPQQPQHLSHHHSGATHVHEQLPHGRTSLFHSSRESLLSPRETMAVGTPCHARLLAAPPAQLRASGLVEHLASARPFTVGTLPSRYVQY